MPDHVRGRPARIRARRPTRSRARLGAESERLHRGGGACRDRRQCTSGSAWKCSRGSRYPAWRGSGDGRLRSPPASSRRASRSPRSRRNGRARRAGRAGWPRSRAGRDARGRGRPARGRSQAQRPRRPSPGERTAVAARMVTVTLSRGASRSWIGISLNPPWRSRARRRADPVVVGHVHGHAGTPYSRRRTWER